MPNELYHDIAESIMDEIKSTGLDFQRGEILQSPVPFHESVIQLWNSPNRILSHDLEERLNFVNPAALKLFGYDISEFIGMPSINLVPNDSTLRQKRAEAFNNVIETGVPEYFENSLRVKKGGEIISVTGWAFRYRINGNYSIGALLLPYF